MVGEWEIRAGDSLRQRIMKASATARISWCCSLRLRLQALGEPGNGCRFGAQDRIGGRFIPFGTGCSKRPAAVCYEVCCHLRGGFDSDIRQLIQISSGVRKPASARRRLLRKRSIRATLLRLPLSPALAKSLRNALHSTQCSRSKRCGSGHRSEEDVSDAIYELSGMLERTTERRSPPELFVTFDKHSKIGTLQRMRWRLQPIS